MVKLPEIGSSTNTMLDDATYCGARSNDKLLLYQSRGIEFDVAGEILPG
ncbi:hypothetical protein [Nostoc sp.]